MASWPMTRPMRAGGTLRPQRHGAAARKAPILEKGKGRNLRIPDSVFLRLELEAIRRGWDKSKLATHLLNQLLPPDIKIVVGEDKTAAAS